MKRMGEWFGQKAGPSASKSLTALDEPQALEDALRAAAKIINDEVEEAEAELSKGTSPFHKLGRSTALFLRAVIGFEKDIMEQASARLAESEESASEHHRRALRDPSSAHQSAIYPPGSEYALCHAESQLMSAVVAVLNESLTESLRGFYKLRKAFYTLHEINEAEKRYLAAHGKAAKSQTSLSESSKGGATTSDASTPTQRSGVMTPADDDEDLEFVEATETTGDHKTPLAYEGHLEFPDMANLSVDEKKEPKLLSAAVASDNEVDFRTVTSDPIDLFIHSGTSLCYGLLQLILSMVPPTFSKLLSLFSFRGDRQTGLKMLWSATNFKNDVNGGMAGLIVLGFHSATMAACDILLKDAMPESRLKALLYEMRELYPKSKLWLLEEARTLAGDQQLEKSVTLLANDKEKSPLKQVEALRYFESSLNNLYMHHFEASALGFLQCIELNSWSHGLYYYIAGICYIELYRDHKTSDPEKAAEYAELADKHLHTVPLHTGKKRFMARQLPFDTFVLRKITKWEQRAKKQGCSFVDAVGVCPGLEMTYFWSGFTRMSEKHLLAALDRLAAYSDTALNPTWETEPADEKAMLHMLQGNCLRFLGRTEEAKTTLTDKVFCYDLPTIKACDYPETWAQPVAHYEMAVAFWQEAGKEDGDKEILKKCSDELAKVEKWEAYDLDTRIGLKVATARGTLKRCGINAA